MTKAELDSIKILPLDDSWYHRVKRSWMESPNHWMDLESLNI